MGTVVIIKLRIAEEQLPHAQHALEQAASEMKNLVGIVSSWEPDSDTTALNKAAGMHPVSVRPQLMRILQKANNISILSDGAFDITFSAVGELWKIRPVLPIIPTEEQIAAALPLVDYRKLVLDADAGTAFLPQAGMQIDLGAIAKGSVADAAAASLLKNGFDDFMINAGGDVRTACPVDAEPWTLGITNPRDPRGDVLGELTVRSGAVVTSGDYEKSVVLEGKRYHHIIDPRIGKPTQGCISVTVIGPNAETADALATAFFVLGPEKGKALCETLPDVEAMFIHSDFQTVLSSGFSSYLKEKSDTHK